MNNKKPLYEADKRALEDGIDARLSIQFRKEPDGKMSALSCSVIKGYNNVDYAMSLDTPIKDIIKDLIQ